MISALWDILVFLATCWAMVFGFIVFISLVGIATKDHDGKGEYDNEV